MDDTKIRVADLELQPLLVKGELVADNWWVPPVAPPQPFVRRHWLFLVTVVVPMAVAIIYLFLIASDQFTSEAQFFVRTSSHGDVGNLASLMGGQKMSRATDESYAVAEYLESRDVVKELVADDHLRDILARPQADMFNRFPSLFGRTTDEALFRHFLHFVDLKIDSESGIGIIKVRAFTPEDARDLARALLKHGEALVNRLNARAFEDALRFAQRQLDEDRGRLMEIEDRLTTYRNQQKIIDPNKEAAAALTSLGTLTSALTEVEVTLSQQEATTPTSPLIPPMRERVQVLRDQIVKQRAEIAGTNSSMAGSMAKFDGLMMEREFAARSLEAAAVHLTTAKQDAEQQQLYLQTIVEPNLPDMALYPRRGLIIFAVFGILLCIFAIMRSLLRVLWEHQA